MKYLSNLSRRAVEIVIIIGLVLVESRGTEPGKTHEFVRESISADRGAMVYSISFPGGSVSYFFQILRTNGFAEDTILLTHAAGNIDIGKFTLNKVRLKEVARSLEYLSEGKINVEVMEGGEYGDSRIWRVKMANTTDIPIKTKAVALPRLLTKPDEGLRRIMKIQGEIEIAFRNHADVTQRYGFRPQGLIRPVPSEKILVVVGDEAYVEAITSALDAAEKVEATKPHA